MYGPLAGSGEQSENDRPDAFLDLIEIRPAKRQYYKISSHILQTNM